MCECFFVLVVLGWEWTIIAPISISTEIQDPQPPLVRLWSESLVNNFAWVEHHEKLVALAFEENLVDGKRCDVKVVAVDIRVTLRPCVFPDAWVWHVRVAVAVIPFELILTPRSYDCDLVLPLQGSSMLMLLCFERSGRQWPRELQRFCVVGLAN